MAFLFFYSLLTLAEELIFFCNKNIFDFMMQTEFPPCHRILLLLEIPYEGENVPTEVKTYFLE